MCQQSPGELGNERGCGSGSGTGLRPGNLRSGLCPAEGANPAASLWGCYSSSCPEFGALGLGAERRPWFPSPVPAFTRTTLCQFGLKGIGARAEGLVSSPFSVPILGTPGQRLGCCHHPQIVPPLLASMARPLSPSRTLQGLSVPCLVASGSYEMTKFLIVPLAATTQPSQGTAAPRGHPTGRPEQKTKPKGRIQALCVFWITEEP